MAAAASSAAGSGGLLDEVANVGVLVQHGYLYFARNALLLHRITEMFKVLVGAYGGGVYFACNALLLHRITCCAYGGL